MGWVFETANSFDPFKVKRHQVVSGTLVMDWVACRHPETREFPLPTICLFNGQPLLRADWNRPIFEGDIVNFIAIPQGIEIIIALIIVVIVMVLVVVLMPVPPPPGGGPESDPVYSVKGQSNEIRLGEPIEVCYGRNRIFPSLASRPFYQYDGNDQYQHSLFCLGQGQFDIEAIQIGDASIASYQEVEYEIIEPGGTTTLFATNVYTSPEAGGHTLLAPNEEEYVPDGWVGPFPVCPVGEVTEKIEIDLVFPKGIYRMDSSGTLKSITITVEAEMRLIDDAGAPLGPYTDLIAPNPITITGKTTTPQRKTYSSGVANGRYEVRLRRTDEKRLSPRAGNDVVWEGLRAFIASTEEHDFGDVTLLAVRIRATNNLNVNTQSRFNVIATRKLPIYESGGFSEPQATRSIVWAIVDIFRSLYGGRLEDGYFDWDTLLELDALYTSREEYFDWIFRDASTVWTTAQAVARAGRAIPLLTGSLVTMKRDGPLEVPVAMFNQENIISGSFQWDIKLWDLDEHDCMQIEYTDPSTGYKQEQVIAVLPGGTSDHPEDIRLAGVQSRTHAYRAGLYMMACRRYLRENVSFDTGMEGFIPTYGDLIAVSHDVPSWGQAGYIANAVRGAGTYYHLWLSEPVAFDSGEEHQILLRGRTANVIGPLDVFETADPQQVAISSPTDIDFLLDGTTEPMLFLFGVSNNITKYLKVVKVEPQGREIIRVSAVAEVPIIHSFDALTPPALGETFFPPLPPDLPEIDFLYLTQIDGDLLIVQVSWTAAFGAQYYIVQTSEDGVHWQEQANTVRTSIQVQAFPGDLYVRVAAVNSGQGPWIEEQMVVGQIASLEESVPWDCLEWWVTWFAVSYAVGYEVKIYDNSESEPILKREETQTDISYLYDYADAVTDSNIVREMLITVDPIFNDDVTGLPTPSGTPVSLELSNAIPNPPTDPLATFLVEESDQVDYDVTWTMPEEKCDLDRVKIWLSAVDGFDPAVDVPFAEIVLPDSAYSPSGSYTVYVPLESGGTHPAYYFRIGLFDVWGSEISTNVTDQQTIPAYP